MTTITSDISSPPRRTAATDGPSPFAEILTFWRQFFGRAFNPYRPELHYMRGPGPAWRAKQMASSPPAFLITLRSSKPPAQLFWAGALARVSVARDHGASPAARFRAVIIAMNGPPHDAAALCNSR